MAVGLDFPERQFGVGTILELGDPALGSSQACCDLFLGEAGLQPLAHEMGDHLGAFSGRANALGGFRRNDASPAEVFDVPVAGGAG